MNPLQKLAAEIVAKRAEAQKFYDDLDAKVDDKGELLPISADDRKSIVDLNKTIEEMEEKYKDLEEREVGKEANARRMKELNAPVRRGTAYATQDEINDRTPAEGKSFADTILSDEHFQKWLEGMKNGEQLRKGQFGLSPSVKMDFGLKTLITGASATSAGALTVNDRKPIVDAFYARPLTIRDLITLGQTDSDTVEFVQITSFTNNAAPVAEATATGDGSGSKPESAMAMAVVTAPVETIAHWIPATRRALADAGQLRTILDTALRYGLDEELEDQWLTGSGTSPNLTGIYNTSNIQTQSFSTDALTSLRKARTKLRTVGRVAPTAWVMHPNDWETIDLLKDNESRYIYGGPAVLGNPRVWGLPVVESEGATEGLPIGADWKMATFWDRQQTEVYVSDSHSDFFTRNMIAILAELRGAFGVVRPKAFITVDVTA